MTTAESQRIAQERLADIAQRQAALGAKVATIQRRLAAALADAGDRILGRPSAADAVLLDWAKKDLTQTVSQWAGDILAIGHSAGSYFRSVAGSGKDYLAAQAQAVPMLLNRFGLNPDGTTKAGGFFDLFVNDTTLRQQVQQVAWKSKSTGAGLPQFKQAINELVDGSPDRNGLVERHFNTFAYDTYQQADATTQDFYAVKLQMPAALYLGGEIAGTREFCHQRQGNVYTRDEIAGWANEEFSGKTPDYNPFTDRGGYNCRHHLHYITARMAAARRSDLTLGPGGSLLRDGKALDPVAPAKATPPAPMPEPEAQVENSAVDAVPGVTYADEAAFKAAASKGGWNTDDVTLAQFNRVLSGSDLEKLGTTLQAQLKQHGIKTEQLQLFSDSTGKSVRMLVEGIRGKSPFIIQRTFSLTKEGARQVEHDLLKIPKAVQGKGLSKNLIQTFYKEYESAGVKLINTHANLDVGGYTWAKYGFSISGRDAALEMLDGPYAKTLKKAYRHLYKEYNAIEKTVANFYRQNPHNAPFPMNIIADMPAAKELLAGSDWQGFMDLNDPIQRAIYEKYIGIK